MLLLVKRSLILWPIFIGFVVILSALRVSGVEHAIVSSLTTTANAAGVISGFWTAGVPVAGFLVGRFAADKFAPDPNDP